MTPSFIKITVKTATITTAVIMIYQISNLLLLYHYLKFEYYVTGVAVIALVTCVLLSNKHHQRKNKTFNNPMDVLTNKELQVLVLISEGKSNKEIASHNFIELSTVKTHINNIYFKLNAKNRKQAILIYKQSLFNSKSTFSPPVVT